MLVLALSGGIATGKSTACRILSELLPTKLSYFDCDCAVHAMLAGDRQLAEEIAAKFGPEVICQHSGKVLREALRARIFADLGARQALEAIIHPRVRRECLASLEQAATTHHIAFIAEVPLLFETGFDCGQALNLVVATSRATQVSRLKARSGWDDELIAAALGSQLPIEEKIRRADVVFWNEGKPVALRAQLCRFAREIDCSLDMIEPTTTAGPPMPASLAASQPSMAALSEGQQHEAQPEAVTPALGTEVPLAATPEHATCKHSVATVPAPAYEPPQAIDLNEFRQRPLAELQSFAATTPARIQPGLAKAQLIYELMCFLIPLGTEVTCSGVLEMEKDSFGMVRDPARSFRPSPDDIHVPAQLFQPLGLRDGQHVSLHVRQPVQRDKYLTTAAIVEVEGKPLAEWSAPADFEKLTPMFPNQRFLLDGPGPEFLGVRVIDLVAPLGKGQRGLIVAPPRGGKTILLKRIASSIRANHPEVELIVLLLDERPEEVTDFEQTVAAPVYASTFDETPKRHAQVAGLVLERAKRMVEQGRDVVLLLDSLTRLARGYNSAMQGGPIGSGGVAPAALQRARKFFGAARNIEDGGSLTILATALIETESRLDDVVFEEFKGTGNMEVKLDRELAERRVYPAIHIPQSGTRNDDRLYHPDEFAKVIDVRRQLAGLPVGDAIVTLLEQLKATKSNAEFLLRGLR